jgi:hypothetical protein
MSTSYAPRGCAGTLIPMFCEDTVFDFETEVTEPPEIVVTTPLNEGVDV